MVLGAHIKLCVTEPDFLEKIPIGQKWPKNRVFLLFKKIMSLVLSGMHAWEKSGSQVIAGNFSWPIRFQYSLIFNISIID